MSSLSLNRRGRMWARRQHSTYPIF